MLVGVGQIDQIEPRLGEPDPNLETCLRRLEEAASAGEFVTRARAAENRIYLLTANRVGREREGEFCGWSQVVDPRGDRIAEAGQTEEGVFLAEIDVEEARTKDLRPIPGKYELYLFADQRSELYGSLVAEVAEVER